MFSNCKNYYDSPSYITIHNQSDNDIYLCLLFTNWEGECTLDRGGSTLKKNSIFEWQPFGFSIERSLRGGGILEFYFVNPNHYNEHHVFYACNLITVKNEILMHYRLTLEDLQRMNWMIVYPPEEPVIIPPEE